MADLSPQEKVRLLQENLDRKVEAGEITKREAEMTIQAFAKKLGVA